MTKYEIVEADAPFINSTLTKEAEAEMCTLKEDKIILDMKPAEEKEENNEENEVEVKEESKKEKAKREKEAKKREKEEKKKEAKRAKKEAKEKKKASKKHPTNDENKENEDPNDVEPKVEDGLNETKEELIEENNDENDSKPALPVQNGKKVKPPKKEEKSRLKKLLNWKEPKTEPKKTPAELSTQNLCQNTKIPRPQSVLNLNSPADVTQLARSLSKVQLSTSSSNLLNITKDVPDSASTVQDSFADFAQLETTKPPTDLLLGPFLDLPQPPPTTAVNSSKLDLEEIFSCNGNSSGSNESLENRTVTSGFVSEPSPMSSISGILNSPPADNCDFFDKNDSAFGATFTNDPFLEIASRTSSPSIVESRNALGGIEHPVRNLKDPFLDLHSISSFGHDPILDRIRSRPGSSASEPLSPTSRDPFDPALPSPIIRNHSAVFSNLPFLETSSRTVSPIVNDLAPISPQVDLSASLDITFDSTTGSRLTNQLEEIALPSLVPDVFVDPYIDYQSVFHKPEPKPEDKLVIPQGIFSDLNPLKKESFVPKEEFFKDRKCPPKKTLVDITSNVATSPDISKPFQEQNKPQLNPWASFAG